MKLDNNIELLDRAVYLAYSNTLIISDLHVGHSESLLFRGVLIPLREENETISKLNSLLGNKHFDRIIVNGDFKHEFGKILKTELGATEEIIDLLKKHTKKIILIKGNHDTLLNRITLNKAIEIKNSESIGDVYICHGHKSPKDCELKNIKKIIIGHEHPAITLSESNRVEKYKCFMVGMYRERTLIVVPSFNPALEGTDVRNRKFLSPLLDAKGDYRIIVSSDKLLDFGLLSDLL